MLRHINGGHVDGTIERRFQTYLRPDLLVLDNFGLKPLHPPEDLYDIINERHERGSIMLTSNRALDAGQLFKRHPCLDLWLERSSLDHRVFPFPGLIVHEL